MPHFGVWHTPGMSTRLQVVLPDEEMKEIKKAAKRENLTVGEWVRRELREARVKRPTKSAEEKIKAIREMAKLNLAPSPDIEQMNREIVQGYLEGFKD